MTAEGTEPEEADGGDEAPPARAPVGLQSYVRYFLWLGTAGFGGPIASVGYMQRDLVEKRAGSTATSSSTA